MAFPLRALIFLCLFCLSQTACSSLSSNIVSNGPQREESFRQTHDLTKLVAELAQPEIDSGHNIGIVVGVLDSAGQQHVYGFGRQSFENDAPPDGDSLFAIGSLTKAFTATLFEKLVAEGRLDPNETVGQIARDESELSPAAKRITLLELLNHASGLPRQPNDFKMVVNLIRYSFTGDDIYSHIDRRALYDYLKEFDPPAGDVRSYRYSNIGVALLGDLIEKKTGQSLEALLSEKVFVPARLADTSYNVPYVKKERLITGHVGDAPLFVARGTPLAPWHMDPIFKGAAGLYSTANDLLRFAAYRLSLHESPVVFLPFKGFVSFGFEDKKRGVSDGWNVDVFDEGRIRLFYHHGMIGGYSAYLGLVPERKIAVVALYNNFDWDDPIGHTLLLTLCRSGS